MYLLLRGEELEIQTCMVPYQASLSPKRPGQDRGDYGVSALVWGGLEVVSYMATTGCVTIPHTARAGPEGLGCIYRCGGGRGWKVVHTRPPHGAPLSPKLLKQHRRDSGASAAMRGGVEVVPYMAPPWGVLITQTG